MKTRKILTAVFLTALISLTAVCLIFGPQLRDSLSPTVEYVYPEFAESGGAYRLSVPQKAIRYDEAGGAYLLIAEVSEKYPEMCYEAHKKEVMIYNAEGEDVILSYGVQAGDRVIVTQGITDGERVITE